MPDPQLSERLWAERGLSALSFGAQSARRQTPASSARWKPSMTRSKTNCHLRRRNASSLFPTALKFRQQLVRGHRRICSGRWDQGRLPARKIETTMARFARTVCDACVFRHSNFAHRGFGGVCSDRRRVPKRPDNEGGCF